MEGEPRMEAHSLDYSYDDSDSLYPSYEGPFRGYEQTVTLHAQMDRGVTEGPSAEVGWFLWGITAEQLPILIGAAAGGLVLLVTMLGLLIWRCCRHSADHDKAYYLQRSEEEVEEKRVNHSVLQSCSESVVFLSSKQGTQAYQSCLVEKQQEPPNNNNSPVGITRSQSAPVKDQEQEGKSATPKKRPSSHPLQFNPCDVTFGPRSYYLHGLSGHNHLMALQLPDIPEMTLRSCEGLEQCSQFVSSSVLDDSGSKTFPRMDPNEAALKTRSLPAWVRARPRPLSTEDDLNELYAKVNFSKKRKNRMRNDSAAAIALNKSRSQFIPFPFMHKDTDSLVDNEAVVVYDERTAL